MDSRKLRYSLMMLVALIAFGTFGYYIFEHMPIFDAFYMTIITISTVGFSEIVPLTRVGRTITVVIIILGISVGTYTVGIIVQWLVGGELQKIFGRRKLHKQITDLKNHFIICGFGRIGHIICKELFEDHINFVVIEQNPAVIEELVSLKYLCLEMDATSEEALQAAGIMRAKGLVTAVNSDANNVFITLTAKGLRPDIFVLARASEEKNEEKLIKAGATRVVSPYLIGARRMAHVLKRPTVVDFLDIATMGNHLGLIMEEAKVGPSSGLIGKNLIENRLRQEFGVIIVAIKKAAGQMIFNPAAAETLEAGDVIVVIGEKEHLKRMSAIL
ncbi:MAG: potassium channel protein [Deltaproteobacteria bacterium]|jgi:voltage-gated potassium channel|nr:potassium channel protein [Deltaproteobacteria bacterium]MBW2479816.1 potassium channel protein [Deltaproteobacteria bacterium]